MFKLNLAFNKSGVSTNRRHPLLSIMDHGHHSFNLPRHQLPASVKTTTVLHAGLINLRSLELFWVYTIYDNVQDRFGLQYLTKNNLERSEGSHHNI